MCNVSPSEASCRLGEAAREMATCKVGCLPVVDSCQFVGIITETALLRHFAGLAPGD